MAKHVGKNGVLHIGGTPIAQFRGWELTEAIRTVEGNVMGDDWVDRDATIQEFTGNGTLFWDQDDAGQAGIPRGQAVAFILYPDGEGTGAWKYSGNVIITEIGQSAEREGYVERRIAFEGKGALTTDQVV